MPSPSRPTVRRSPARYRPGARSVVPPRAKSCRPSRFLRRPRRSGCRLDQTSEGRRRWCPHPRHLGQRYRANLRQWRGPQREPPRQRPRRLRPRRRRLGRPRRHVRHRRPGRLRPPRPHRPPWRPQRRRRRPHRPHRRPQRRRPRPHRRRPHRPHRRLQRQQRQRQPRRRQRRRRQPRRRQQRQRRPPPRQRQRQPRQRRRRPTDELSIQDRERLDPIGATSATPQTSIVGRAYSGRPSAQRRAAPPDAGARGPPMRGSWRRAGRQTPMSSGVLRPDLDRGGPVNRSQRSGLYRTLPPEGS